jgi:excisionase family DNA binding protein
MKMLNIMQLSEMLNVKRNTIYDWVHRNRIPYYKIEGSLRFEYSEIVKWLKSKKQSARTGSRIL